MSLHEAGGSFTDPRVPGRGKRLPGPVGLALIVLAVSSADVAAQHQPLDLAACQRIALQANPDFQSRRAAVDATRAALDGARSDRFPSVGLSASAARYESGGTGALDRHDVGVSLRQTLYRGGRVAAGVDAAAAALDADQGNLEAARADLLLAVVQGWYRVAQAERLVLATQEGVERSRLNLEYAEAQLAAGLGTRPDVLRARVDVSAAELDLTRASNALDGARALLNALMGQPPAQPLALATEEVDAPLPPLPPWEELRRRALESRDELRVAAARTARQEAFVRIARGGFLPSVSADAGVGRGATASRSAQGSWSVGVVFSLPIFDGFGLSADLRAERALLESARFAESAVARAVEGEVWAALLADGESGRRLENARALFAAARENLEAAQEGYRLGLGSMIGLVDARTAYTGAEQTLVQALHDRRIARAILERVVQGDTFGRDRP